jgi:putative component of membrane protein insertase Oxa1/YidC/SpoIIIJ protein YidD
MKGVIFTCIATLCLSLNTLAQSSLTEDVQFIRQHYVENQNVEQENYEEAKGVVQWFLLAYKRYVSSQDAMSCSFYPSCSVYGAQSVNQFGVTEGLLNTFDRISRCYGANNRYYPRHPETNLNYDPL